MCICIILRVNTFATGHVTLQITQNNDNPDLKSLDGISSNKTQKARTGGTPKKNSAKLSFNVRGLEN